MTTNTNDIIREGITLTNKHIDRAIIAIQGAIIMTEEYSELWDKLSDVMLQLEEIGYKLDDIEL